MKDRDVIIACDFNSGIELSKFLTPFHAKNIFPFVKIGLELFCAEGKFVFDELNMKNNVFLDLKLHDIPTTVGKTVKVLDQLPIDILSVHGYGGEQMLTSASVWAENINLAAVTFLTSNFLPGSEKVEDMFDEIRYTGINHVICPVCLVPKAKQIGFKTICPGIRLEKGNRDDQYLIATPKQAKEAGADYIVVGRSITQSKDPVETYLQICNDFL